MKKIRELCSRRTLSWRICTSTSTLLIIAAFLISFTLPFLYGNIKKSQILLPQTFFDSYNRYSLEEVGKNAKDFILAGVDARNNWISSIKQSMSDSKFENLSLRNKYQNASFLYGNKPNQVNCMLSNLSNSIFKCEMDLYTTILLKESWKFNTRAKTKRFNIYYQNANDPNDVMVKTISAFHDFKVPNASKIYQQLQKQREGILTFSNFYIDYNGQSGDSLVAFRTKIIHSNYSVLLQLQSFGTLFTVTITRVLYSDSVNIIILSKNSTDSKGYSLVSSFKDLNPHIDYKNLLQPGFTKTQLFSDHVLYSFTSYFSSAYQVGSLTLQSDKLLNFDYVAIVHSLSVSEQMEDTIYHFINSLKQSLVTFTAFGFAMLIVLVLTFSSNTASILGNTFSISKQSLSRYLFDPTTGTQVLNQIMLQGRKQQFLRTILRTLYQIIKIIQFKKTKHRKTKIQKNKYPLNMLQKQFQSKFQRSDSQILNQLYKKIVMIDQQQENKVQKNNGIC